MFYDVVSSVEGAKRRMIVKAVNFASRGIGRLVLSFKLPLKDLAGKLMILS